MLDLAAVAQPEIRRDIPTRLSHCGRVGEQSFQWDAGLQYLATAPGVAPAETFLPKPKPKIIEQEIKLAAHLRPPAAATC